MKGIKMLAAVGFFAVLGIAGLPAAAMGEVVHADLDGYSEVPAVSTTGTGEFVARINQSETAIDYVLSYQNLEGSSTIAAHIHLGQEAVNGGVSAFLCSGTKPPCPTTSGTVSGTITAADIVGPTAQGIAPGELAELIRAIRAGFTYANVHTTKHPGGEIRGPVRGHGVGQQ